MEHHDGAFKRSLSLMDGVLLVVGSMIGSGIFIVSADIAAQVGSAGWLIAIWLVSGFITVAAALSYAELSGMFPHAGGQYVYLKEAFGKFYGFLYGWSFFAVIQTGTIAAVGVAFGKFTGYLVPALGDENILFSVGAGFHISAAQITGITTVVFLTFLNTFGVKSGKYVQFAFTFTKIAAILGLLVLGLTKGFNPTVWHDNWLQAWNAVKITVGQDVITHSSLKGNALFLALCGAMVGALFSSDAWNSVTFIAGELKNPAKNIGLSLFIGTLAVTVLYVGMNFMYLGVLSVPEIAHAPSRRVATLAAQKILGDNGAGLLAILIMVSTFGCNNGLILSGARVYHTMAQDKLFLPAAGSLNRSGVPANALWMQCIWASVLCISGQYGNLLDYIVFTVLLFYIMTILGIFKLRTTRRDAPRLYKAFGYPYLPLLYIFLATLICVGLLISKPEYPGFGLLIVLLGIPVYYITQKKK
jgi:basic amino acid/polyamine antiporter, APA family